MNPMKNVDVHLHFPAGAVGKDGPSAGVTIATALVSLFTNRVIKQDLAMTGEITLRGVVLPVGGIKEKVIAAHRGGIKTVLLPKRNAKDVKDIPEHVKKSMEIHLVSSIEDVVEKSFEDFDFQKPIDVEKLINKL